MWYSGVLGGGVWRDVVVEVGVEDNWKYLGSGWDGSVVWWWGVLSGWWGWWV